MKENLTKYRYLRDPANPDRVFTLAYVKEGTHVHAGMAVCKPARAVTTVYSDHSETFQVKGDTFTKRKGRAIAEHRMRCPKIKIVLPYQQDIDPVVTLAEFILVHEHELPVFFVRTFKEFLEANTRYRKYSKAPVISF